MYLPLLAVKPYRKPSSQKLRRSVGVATGLQADKGGGLAPDDLASTTSGAMMKYQYYALPVATRLRDGSSGECYMAVLVCSS